MKIILKGVVGSHLYGLSTPESDIDTKGVFVRPTEELLGISRFCGPDTIDSKDPDDCMYEVGKFIKLAMGANPTILELLYLPEYTHLEGEGELLINYRGAFLSNLARKTYSGYAIQQIRKLKAHEGDYFEQATRNRYSKHARHCYRLIEQGLTLLKTGEIVPQVSNRELYFRIGNLPYVELEEMFAEGINSIDNCVSILRDEPDYNSINHVLMRIRRANLHSGELWGE